jgi:hypothetical protein
MLYLILGDIYLSTHTQVGTTKEETERLLEEHNSFKVFASRHSSCTKELYLVRM